MRHSPQADIIETARSYLASKLPAYIQAVGTQVGESLEDYREYLAGPYDPFSHSKQPFLTLVTDRAIRDQSDRIAGLRADVLTTHVDRNPAGLENRKLWYTDALLNLFDEHHRFGLGLELASYEEPSYYSAPAGQQSLGMTLTKIVLVTTYSRKHGIG